MIERNADLSIHEQCDLAQCDMGEGNGAAQEGVTKNQSSAATQDMVVLCLGAELNYPQHDTDRHASTEFMRSCGMINILPVRGKEAGDESLFYRGGKAGFFMVSLYG